MIGVEYQIKFGALLICRRFRPILRSVTVVLSILSQGYAIVEERGLLGCECEQ
jgi:hypothetical protein